MHMELAFKRASGLSAVCAIPYKERGVVIGHASAITVLSDTSGGADTFMQARMGLVQHMSLLTDNTLFSVSMDSHVRVWDISRGHETTSLNHGSGIPLGVATLSSTSVATTCDNTIRVWDVRTKDNHVAITAPRFTHFRNLHRLPDGRLLTTLNGVPCIYDLRTGQREWSGVGHVHAMTALPNGNVAFVEPVRSGAGLTVLTPDGRDVCRHALGSESDVVALPGGDLVTMCKGDMTVRLHDSRTGAVKHAVSHEKFAPLAGILYHRLVALNDGRIGICEGDLYLVKPSRHA